MSDSTASKRRPSGTLPLVLVIPLAFVLVLVFVAILFPWDAVARRLAFEIGSASGARVSLEDLAPAWTARGPVLRARNVSIEHPSVRLLRVAELEVAPRFSTSWLRGKPRMRIYADSDLGVVDGVLLLGDAPAFDGRVARVAIERLPLRLSAAGVRVAGELSADADVALDPAGTLHGQVAFESPRLRLEALLLPKPLEFTQASGSLSILETGATRIENVKLEGPQLRGTLSGEIGLVHRSQPPPLDLRADLEVVDPELRALAQAAQLPIPPDGHAFLEIRGTAAAPQLIPAAGPRPGSPAPGSGAPGAPIPQPGSIAP
ncbi:type II secretion system protein GspN [Myxococcota bacterium]|nr:type II secretion system protein GspN [Myxococcota bacterium]